jgi:hypothetical protein
MFPLNSEFKSQQVWNLSQNEDREARAPPEDAWSLKILRCDIWRVFAIDALTQKDFHPEETKSSPSNQLPEASHIEACRRHLHIFTSSHLHTLFSLLRFAIELF